MQIHGFQKLTLLDYPEKVACTVFFGGCNFRCPFCHNGNLVLHPGDEPLIAEEEIWELLEKRRGVLDGVCVTGGEPTLEPDLPAFLTKIKSYGYLVKLDTNGYRPEVLKELVLDGLVDYVAMDIKNAPDRYALTAGVPGLDMTKIQESVEYLLTGVVDYEFRTTVTRELHQKQDFDKIGRWIAGCRRYYLQNYKESDFVIHPVFSGYSREQLERFAQELRRTITVVGIRGID
ncbi:MAG: anaerobic ribonucleoside-triphosphate reductase activating protein [Lachnospiraceae bacterium]|nr:anaerobic ribonucleoside-triphosphate reductase activating protein [Lachnospiraceae bacterium]